MDVEPLVGGRDELERELTMTPHRFSPMTALLGVAVLAMGIVVSLFGVDRLGDDPIVWGAAAAVFVALILVALPVRSAEPSSSPDPGER